MDESTVNCRRYPVYESADSLESFHVKGNTEKTKESGHSNNDHCNLYETLNVLDPGKAKPAQGLNRPFIILVIIVCLISLLALLLTIWMLVGKIGSSNEGQCTG